MLPEDLDAPPFTDDDLDAWFEWDLVGDGPIDEETSANPKIQRVVAWSVCDTGSAEYAMRKLAHAEAFIAKTKADAQRFKEQIERWEAEQLRRPERAVNFFTGQLITYARHMREDEGVKTLKLPSGQVPSRLNPARAEIPKEAKEAFVEWARERELPVVKATWSPVMDEVKKAVTFRTVAFPEWVSHGEQVYDVDDGLVVLPASSDPEKVEAYIEGMDLAALIGNGYVERPSTAIYRRDDGSWWLVPGVVEVQAEVTYSVKPALP
jgi:hypothetical protein